MKLMIALMLFSVTSFSAESAKDKLPEIGHLLKVVCVNGTQYYFYKEVRSRGLSPVIKEGKFLQCESNKQSCKFSIFDGSLICE